MTLNEYQTKALVTDVRPDKYKMICNGFGFIGELEELKVAESEEDRVKEFGDVLWYSASICSCFGVKLDTVLHKFPQKFEDDKPFAEVFKKVYRDKDGEFDTEDKERILGHIHVALNKFSANVNILAAAKKNIDKLYSRLERNMIKGNGNNR